MTRHFQAEVDPSDERCAAIAGLAPRNPFYTASYVAARRAGGVEPWALFLVEDGALESGCSAFLSRGRLRRALEIESLPRLPAGDDFWSGLRRVCREQRITELTVNSFASEAASLPALGPLRWQRHRAEYRIDLAAGDSLRDFSTNHRRNLRRAEQAELTVHRARDIAGCETHVRLMDASMERHGRPVSGTPPAQRAREFFPLTESGAGELFQAQLGDEVVSSVFVLRAALAGYYYSAGTSKEGMNLGAAHFLVREIAEALRGEGRDTFNLGGVDAAQAGLSRFKEGFGAERVELEAGSFSVGNPLHRMVASAANLALAGARRVLSRGG